MDQDELRDRLNPPTLDETRARVDAAHQAGDDDLGEATSKDEEVYTFPFEHKTRRGKVYRGRITTRILSIQEQEKVGQQLALMRLGSPIESFDIRTQDIQRARVHLAHSLVDPPDWARSEALAKVPDYDMLAALYTEVLSHERWFLFREVYPA